MPDYRRADVPGAAYFFTVVSHRRRPVLCDHAVRIALRDAIKAVKHQHVFRIDAWVLLPDHMHCIWTLPENDHAYSMRWSMIKRLVTQAVGNHFGGGTFHGAPDHERRVRRAHQMNQDSFECFDHGVEPLMSASRRRRRESAMWQRRFWEHCIRNQADMSRCLDYLHWNPVKHGHACSVAEWPYSTFHRYVREGVYPADWGGNGVVEDGAFGE